MLLWGKDQYKIYPLAEFKVGNRYNEEDSNNQCESSIVLSEM